MPQYWSFSLFLADAKKESEVAKSLQLDDLVVDDEDVRRKTKNPFFSVPLEITGMIAISFSTLSIYLLFKISELIIRLFLLLQIIVFFYCLLSLI